MFVKKKKQIHLIFVILYVSCLFWIHNMYTFRHKKKINFLLNSCF